MAKRIEQLDTEPILIEGTHSKLVFVKHQNGPALMIWQPEQEYVDAMKELEENLGPTEFGKALVEEFKRGVCCLSEAFTGRLVGSTDG